MSKWLVWAALVALGCGGESALFDEARGAGLGEAGETSEAGSAGAPLAAGGSKAQAGEAAGGRAGEAPAVTAGSGSAGGGEPGGTAGTGSAGGGGQGQGGSAGAPVAGSGGVTHAAGSAGGTQAGASGSGGSSTVCSMPAPAEGCSVCEAEDNLDCNGVADDGPQLDRDCESWKGDHDNCGGCGMKCGLSQICKTAGGPGAWTYYCGSP